MYGGSNCKERRKISRYGTQYASTGQKRSFLPVSKAISNQLGLLKKLPTSQKGGDVEFGKANELPGNMLQDRYTAKFSLKFQRPHQTSGTTSHTRS